MILAQAALAVTLWRTGQFDTVEIAREVQATEAEVCRVLNAVREAERAPRLTLVEAS